MSVMDENNNVTGQSQLSAEVSQQKRQKTGSKKSGNQGSSDIWKHMKRHMADGKFLGIATCNYCNMDIKCPSANGTTLLWTHVKKRCKSYPKSENDNKQKLLTVSGNQAKTWKFDQEVCRKSLARMIILCELPFSFVEKEGFKMFVNDLNPKFNVVCRKTITTDCFHIFFEEKKKLRDYFKISASRVSLTTDLWTSIQNLGYMCLTAHFVDKDWILHKKIINFRVLPHPHRGEAIAKAIELCLLEWGLEKLFTITLDNAKNNDKCVEDLKKRFNKRGGLLLGGEFFHVRCFAHIINLVVRDGIGEVHNAVKRLRSSVKYVRSSPSRLQAFKKCAMEESINSKKSVCLDVKTRWNSTYLMIGAAMQYQKAFERLEEHDISYKLEVGSKGMGTIDDSDWRTLKALHTFLEDFYLLTLRISGSHFVTSNTYFDEVSATKDLLLGYMGNNDPFFSDMASKMNEKFDKYCDISSLNLILVVALVLDPRYKLQYVEYWYDTFFSKYYKLSADEIAGKVHDFVERLKSVMSNLYSHYKVECDLFVDVSSNKSLGGGGGDVGLNTCEVVEKRAINKKGFSNYLKRKEHVESMNDLERYLQDGVEDLEDNNFDILSWWKGKVATYRALSMMARDVLTIPVTSVASECAFSTSKRVLDPFRSSLTPNTVETLVCTQDWLRSSNPMVDSEETLEMLEDIEKRVIEDMEALTLASSSTHQGV